MPRYMVERSFPDGLELPNGQDGRRVCDGLVASNGEQHVTWIQSFVTDDRRKTFCVYDGPTPEAIRRAAEAGDLPVDSIAEVSVLDPYFYVGNGS